MENQETKEVAPKKREIKKIIPKVGGLKGIEIFWNEESIEKNKSVTNTFSGYLKNPIHRELEDKIADLRAHVLEICGLVTDTTPKARVFELREGCEILSIEFETGEDSFFKIKASSRVLDSKFQNICTPKVEVADGYEYFSEVMDLIKEILIETDHYVNKTKVISNEELFLSWVRHGKNVDVNIDEYEAIEDREEKAKFLEKKLASLGFIANLMDTEEMNEEEMEEVESEETSATDELDFEEPHFESQTKSK